MPPLSSSPLLAAAGLSATLAGDDGPVEILDGIDLSLGSGEVVDVVGPSGAGKSTLLRAFARLLPKAHGSLALRGYDASGISAADWRVQVALLPQKPAITTGTVGENLLLPFTLKVHAHAVRPSTAALRMALDRLGLVDIAIERDAARLSVGQQARVALARVLLTEPAVLLLDEVDAALDDESVERVRDAVARFVSAGGGVVRVRHRADDGLAVRRLRLAHGLLTEVPR